MTPSKLLLLLALAAAAARAPAPVAAQESAPERLAARVVETLRGVGPLVADVGDVILGEAEPSSREEVAERVDGSAHLITDVRAYGRRLRQS